MVRLTVGQSELVYGLTFKGNPKVDCCFNLESNSKNSNICLANVYHSWMAQCDYSKRYEGQIVSSQTLTVDQFLDFCEKGDSYATNFFLENGFQEVNAGDKLGRTALHWWAWYQDIQIIRKLLQKGADVHTRMDWGWLPLHDCIIRENYDITALLLSHGSDPTITTSESFKYKGKEFLGSCLDFARTLGNEDLCKMLELDIYMRDLPQDMKFEEYSKVVARIKVPQVIPNDFPSAVKCGNLDLVKHYLELKENSNGCIDLSDGSVPYIVYAATHYDLDMCHLLLENGANVNQISYNGSSALHKAAENGLWPLFSLLIEGGADIRAKDVECQYVLHSAIRGNNLKIVDYLLRKNVNPNVQVSNPLEICNNISGQEGKDSPSLFDGYREKINEQPLR